MWKAAFLQTKGKKSVSVDLFYHFVYLTVHSGKVAVEHDFLLTGILEGVDLGDVNVLGFFFLDLSHIVVGFTKVFRRLELSAFFKVDAAERAALCGRKVTGCLSGEPTGGHVGNLGRRNEVVHLLTDGGADL